MAADRLQDRPAEHAAGGKPQKGPVARLTGRPAALARLQRRAGNAAVAHLIAPKVRAEAVAPPEIAEAIAPVGLLYRQATACPPPPVAPTDPHPEEDPKFQAVEEKLGDRAGKLKQHPKPTAEAKKAQDAAQPPPTHKAGQAKAAQAEKMADAKKGEFDKKAFIEAVKKAIEAASPKNLKEANDFASSGKAGQVKGKVAGLVSGGKQASEKDIKEKTTQAPDQSKAKDKPVTPLAQEPAVKNPGDPGAARAMPDQAPPEQTNLKADECEVDSEMAEAGVDEKQLKKANEPEFDAALDAKKEGERHSAEAPAEVRAEEEQILDEAKTGAEGETKGALAAMVGAKSRGQGKVAGDKAKTKSKDEVERARVTAEIEAIYVKTKAETEAILTALDGKVAKEFERGEASARRAFEESHSREMRAYKKKRYSGLRGKARWIRDKFADLPSEVNVFYDRARKLYLSLMDSVIGRIADLVGAELTRAKSRIEHGRAEIAAYVARQPKNLRKVALDAQRDISEKFNMLESDVDSKQDALVQDLAQKYVAARNAVDERIKALQEANKGLWSKAKDFVKGVIEMIKKLGALLLSVLAKAAGAVGKILKNPIGFLGKLVSAVRSGLSRFVDRIGEHLKSGLSRWLLGSLAGAGLELPAKFDLKGIVHVVAQLLGLTWQSIRARIVKALGRGGEKIMARLEQASEVVQTLVKEGPAGLWKQIVEKMSDLKELVIGKIKEFVVTRIIIAGITWLVSLLNPASAFIKACKAIVDIVKFFIERGSEIMEFVNTVLDSIGAIASGAIGAAASAIENVLARILPLVISFLAALLGLGGIADKIRSIIESVQRPVGRVIDGIIGGVVKFGKKLLQGGKAIGAKAKQAAKNAFDWLKFKLSGGKADQPFAMKGVPHTLSATVVDDKADISMASAMTGRLRPKLEQAIATVSAADFTHKDKGKILMGLRTAYGLSDPAESYKEWQAEKAKRQRARAMKPEKQQNAEATALKLWQRRAEKRLADIVKPLLGLPDLDEILLGKKEDVRYLPPGFDGRKLYTRGQEWGPVAAEKKREDLSTRFAMIDQMTVRLSKEEQVATLQEWVAMEWLPGPDYPAAYVDPVTLVNQGRKAVIAHVEKQRYDADHDPPLAAHWGQFGRNLGDAERTAYACDPAHPKMFFWWYNQRKGAGGENFGAPAGPNFTSILAEGGLPNAKTIDGKPFLDNDKKPIG